MGKIWIYKYSKFSEAVLLVLNLNKKQKPSTFFLFYFFFGSNCFLLQQTWQIDRLVTLTLVCRFMSTLNQTPMSSASRTNPSEGCVVVRSEVVYPTCHCSAPVLLLLFRSCLASNPLWLVKLFVTFISCCMMWKCIVFRVYFLSFYKLHGGSPPFVGAPCCFGDVITFITPLHIFYWET